MAAERTAIEESIEAAQVDLLMLEAAFLACTEAASAALACTEAASAARVLTSTMAELVGLEQSYAPTLTRLAFMAPYRLY